MRGPSWRSTSTWRDLGLAARERQRRPAPAAPRASDGEPMRGRLRRDRRRHPRDLRRRRARRWRRPAERRRDEPRSTITSTATSTARGHEHLSEEELRARLEEELRRITVRDVLLQTIVSLVNLGGQRLGLAPGAEDMRDLDQARLAIEGVRALLPLVEEQDAEQVRPIRDALSQLQLAYAQLAAARADAAPGGAGPERPERRPRRPPPGAGAGAARRRRRPVGAAGQRRLIATTGARRQAAHRDDRYTAAAFGRASAPRQLRCLPRRPRCACGHLNRHDGGRGN